jgi:hypothetical protein
VLVIDPRETYTVGPFVRLLDAVVERSQPYWEESTPKRVPDAAERLAVQTADTRAGRAVIRLFEPPEPLRQAGDDETAEAGNTNSETATGGAPRTLAPLRVSQPSLRTSVSSTVTVPRSSVTVPSVWRYHGYRRRKSGLQR